jgi:polar amino acid transport system substrate-binding protein
MRMRTRRPAAYDGRPMRATRTATLMLMVLSSACARAGGGLDAGAELAPHGTLRAGVSIVNPVLAVREVARRLGVPIEFVAFDSAAALAEAAAEDVWDIAFLAADPDRADRIAFTEPYLELEATYLVPATSAIRRVDEVDVAGLRVASRPRAAYDLFLRRSLQHATLVYAEGARADVDLLTAGEADVLAGLRGPLIETLAAVPGSRLLDDNFAEMQQAIGVPAARAASVTSLNTLIGELKRSGFVADAIARTGASGARVAGQ